jgi:hypothetical protein
LGSRALAASIAAITAPNRWLLSLIPQPLRQA